MAEAQRSERMAYLDSIRGLAALQVVFFHFYGGYLHPVFAESWPAPVRGLVGHGWVGVQVFFVLSGYVIAASMSRTRFSPSAIRLFMARRWLRLSPPYYAATLAAVALPAISVLILHRQAGTSELPNFVTFVAHFFYLQHIVGTGSVIGVFWTLCIEMQMYLVFALLMWLCQRMERTGDRPAVRWSIIGFSALASFVSIWTGAAGGRLKVLFLPYWYIFLMGAFAWWAKEGRTGPLRFWLFSGMVAVTIAAGGGVAAAVALGAGLLIYACGRFPRVAVPLEIRPLAALGAISYSLYLTHQLIIRYVLAAQIHRLGERPSAMVATAVALFDLVLALALAAAVYRWIERPAMQRSKRLKQAQTNIA